MSAEFVDYNHWLHRLDEASFLAVADAAEGAVSIHQSLTNDGLSVVSEWLASQTDQPIEAWVHYPADDCRDPDSGAMVYYHAHDPRDWNRDEHGHFHLFVRADAAGDFSHVAAISMTPYGIPNGMFATNGWVTDESMRPAAEVLRMLDENWMINRARPSWLVLKWLDALLTLTRPWVEKLLSSRDRVVGWGEEGRSLSAILDDRDTHILSELPLDWPAILKSVQAEARNRMHQDVRGTLVSC
jgi:hypothetical protein